MRETTTDLILRDADDKEITVPLKQIEEKAPGKSLMPEGLADPLTRAELIDLVRFLSELGKVGPYSVGKARLVRRWQVLEPTAAAKQHLQHAGFAAAAGDDPGLTWAPAYSTVAGVLPLDAAPLLEIRKQLAQETHQMAFVRCQLDVSTAGKAKLLLNSATGVSLWLDGVPVEVKDVMVLDLASGVRTLTFALDLSQRRDGLRCELDDVADSPARVRIVGGK